MSSADTIDRFLGIDSQQLTPPMANAILTFTATDEVKSRVAELAEKANFGTISSAEQEEYEGYIELDTLLTIAKSRARQYLNRSQ